MAMSLFLEPGKLVPREVEGVTFFVRVLTAREQLTLLEHAEKLDRSEDGVLAASMRDDLWAVLRLGVADWVENGSPRVPGIEPLTEEQFDTIPIRIWGQLTNAIVEVNQIGAGDQKNSPASSEASTDT
jgi:hypothetical protein